MYNYGDISYKNKNELAQNVNSRRGQNSIMVETIGWQEEYDRRGL